MKLWQKGKTANKKVDQFTVGKDREYDLVLAPVSYTHLTLPTKA